MPMQAKYRCGAGMDVEPDADTVHHRGIVHPSSRYASEKDPDIRAGTHTGAFPGRVLRSNA
jgi:hypothetical protein